MTRRAPAAARGFTLVELLVVIGIMSVLIGLLLPAVGAALNYMAVLNCQSNLKQIAVAVLSYAAQNDDAILPAGFANAPGGGSYGGQNFYWCNILVKNELIAAPNTMRLENRNVSTSESNIFRCAEGSEELVDWSPAPEPGADRLMGFVRLGNVAVEKQTVDCWYYYNGETGQEGFPASLLPAGSTNPVHYTSEIRDQSSLVMACDGIGIGQGGVAGGFRIAARHGGNNGPRTATNIVYWDGHAVAYNWDDPIDEDPLYVGVQNNLKMTRPPYFRLVDQP